VPSSRSAALNLAREIAQLADVALEQVLGYFSFTGRLSTDVQQRITAAEVVVLGMGRDRRTRRRILTLMNYADFWIETEFEGQSVTLNAA
jgi:hypothetical protein